MLDEYFNNLFVKFEESINKAIALGIKQGIEEAQKLAESKAESQIFSRKEAAKYLKISVVTLDSLVESGVIPSHALGKTIRFKQHELDNSFRARKFSKH